MTDCCFATPLLNPLFLCQQSPAPQLCPALPSLACDNMSECLGVLQGGNGQRAFCPLHVSMAKAACYMSLFARPLLYTNSSQGPSDFQWLIWHKIPTKVRKKYLILLQGRGVLSLPDLWLVTRTCQYSCGGTIGAICVLSLTKLLHLWIKNRLFLLCRAIQLYYTFNVLFLLYSFCGKRIIILGGKQRGKRKSKYSVEDLLSGYFALLFYYKCT